MFLPAMPDVPRHIVEKMEATLLGAVVCVGLGLILLIAAVVLIRRARRRSQNEPFS